MTTSDEGNIFETTSDLIKEFQRRREEEEEGGGKGVEATL